MLVKTGVRLEDNLKCELVLINYIVICILLI